MRVIECNACGEALAAANDAELARRLSDHMAADHDHRCDPGEAEAAVADRAYEAGDS